MADIVIVIAAEVAKALVKPAIRQGQFLFCVNKIVRDLDNEKEELISKRDSIQSLVEQAKQRTEIIEVAVNKWLNDVDSLLGEVAKLEQDVKESGCFQGWCPTWRRYRLCREISKTTKRITAFKNRERFEPFSHPPPLPGIEYDTSKIFTYFESTKVAYNQLMEALKNDNIYMIGLYGMGGSGKTTLATEVGEKAKSEMNLFNQVISVTVSQTPNVRSIQGKLADMLNLKLEKETEEGRARELWSRLKAEKRVLIIVDDVWKKFNLKEVGLCLDDNNKLNFKILLTTRQRQVCVSMDCQKAILLDLLSKTEGWSLFTKHAGIGDGSPSNLLEVARKVSDECKGLPIAIKAVASSLKEKGFDEWKVALERLRNPDRFDDNEEEGFTDAFACLKLSYDYLRNKKAKMIFLMCSMFPEDHEISIEDLIRYGVGLGLSGDFISFDLARSCIRVGINKLVDSCLLFYYAEEGHVKMHDVVRDVALWIASKDHIIMVNLVKSLNALIDHGAIKDCYALSSWYNNGIDQFPQGLDAPKLEILLLNLFANRIPQGLIGSLELSDASFQGMKALKVVAVINKYYYQKVAVKLPASLQLLTTLRTLRLVGWDLGDISFVVSLKRLEILDLRDSKFKQLPNGIETLNKLKLLDLSNCRIEESCFEVIRRCPQLEELYAYDYGHCSSPGIMDPYECFEDDINSPNLQRYKLYIGPFTGHPFEVHSLSTRLLYINGFSPTASDAFIKYLLQRTWDVRLYGLHGGCKNIFPDTVQAVGCMNELTHLQLHFCSEMECLIDTTSNNAEKFPVDATFPRLVELRLEHFDNLKELWHGPVLHCFFDKLEVLRMGYCNQLRSIFPRQCNMQNLKRLSLSKCRRLTSLFPMSVARTLKKLEYVIVRECLELRHIINDEEVGANTGEGTVPAPENSRVILPKLRELTISSCDKLEFILPISCVESLLQLQKIRISFAPKLKYVFGQCNHEDQLSYLNGIKMVLPLLEELELERLPDLLSIFSENYHLSWVCLRKLQWRNCPKLSTKSSYSINYASEDRQLPTTGVHLSKECLTSKLEQLSLLDVRDLRFIWTGSTLTHTLNLQYLKYLSVSGCRKLQSIFPVVIHRSLPELLELYIGSCEELEEIIAENEEYDDVFIPQVCFPKLARIEVRRCSKLKSLFSTALARMLPQLSSLIIVDAPQLMEIFRHRSQAGDVDREQIILPNLRQIKLEQLKSLVDVGIKLHTRELTKVIRECPKLRSSN